MPNEIEKTFIYQVDKITRLTSNISEVQMIAKNSSNRLEYLPGQYVYIYLSKDKKLPYSLASSPRQKYLRFLINHGKNDQCLISFKQHLKSEIEISAAAGHAYYHSNENNILAISKGLGIAPIIAILENLGLQNIKLEKNIIIMDVVASREDLIFEKYFSEISAKINVEYKNFVTEGCYNLEKLYKDFVDMHQDLNSYDFYVFGSKLFVFDIYNELLPYCSDNFYSDVNIAI